MKKIYSTPDYKRKHRRKLLKLERRKRNVNKHKPKKVKKKKIKEKPLSEYEVKPKILSPEDFRLIENTEECLAFFSNLRNPANMNTIRGEVFTKMSLKNVKKIDCASISVLTAIMDDFAYKDITVQGDFPEDINCKTLMENSGFLDHITDLTGRKFRSQGKSDLVYFTKGGRLSEEDHRKISKIVRKVINHMNGGPEHYQPIKTIILEICGNSIEWSGADNKLWLLGIMYEDEKIVFTLTDVGNGILETLHIKGLNKVINYVRGFSRLEILKGAFLQRYGSTSQEINRNKGLPSVKAASDEGRIRNLKLITNDVILHFTNDELSRTLDNISFDGTFYAWELTSECIEKMN